MVISKISEENKAKNQRRKIIREESVSLTVTYPKYDRKITIKVVKKYGKLLKAVGKL